jgi:ubiquinone/menaquinone biosynthesis C-methylase UbiE
MLSTHDCHEFKKFTDKFQRTLYFPMLSRIRSACPRPNVILDVGTGPGYLTLGLAENFSAKIHAIDINPTMHEITRGVLHEHGQLSERIQFDLVDVHKMPYPGDYADLVVSYTCYHHYYSPVLALRELFRVLRPGGALLIIDCQPISEKTLRSFERQFPTYAFHAFVKKAFDEAFDKNSLLSHLSAAGITSYTLEDLRFSNEEFMENLDRLNESDFTSDPDRESSMWIAHITKEEICNTFELKSYD